MGQKHLLTLRFGALGSGEKKEAECEVFFSSFHMFLYIVYCILAELIFVIALISVVRWAF